VIYRHTTVSGKLRALAAAAAIALTTTGAAFLAGGPAAWADGGSGGSGNSASGADGSSQASLQVQAQELAAQIEADGRRLDQMAEAVNAAQLRSQQLAGQLANLQAAMAESDAKATAARAALKQQAVMSYVVGGAPAVSSVPCGPRNDPSLAISYAEIVTGGQKRALAAYRAALAEQSGEAQQVVAAQHEATVNLQQLEAARSSAAQADAARRQALSQVNGEIAVLVAQVEAAQQAAAKAAVLTSAPTAPSSPAVTSPPATSAPTTRRSNPPAAQPGPTSAPKSTSPPTTAPPYSGGSSGGSQQTGTLSPQAPGANKAIAYARAQLGKPYQWGGAGPDSFDCSGLTMMAWEQAGVYFPHLAQDQYDMTQRESISEALPGDLIFFGTPSNVYHVGLYIGNGQMIDAPETGQDVSIQSIYWSNLLGAGRVTG
jgi:cell wall-associated NlpC family hydrolase